MSLITINKENLKNTAIITIRQAKNNQINHYMKNDFTIIKDSEGIISLNIRNYSQYFSAKEGTHTLTNEQKNFVNENWNVFLEDWFLVGKIISREEHPKSKRLFLLKVDIKTNVLTIVTNTKNSLIDNNVVVAMEGSILPNGTEVKLSKIMGVKSQGMLCGGESLGKTKTDGVIITNEIAGAIYKV